MFPVPTEFHIIKNYSVKLFKLLKYEVDVCSDTNTCVQTFAFPIASMFCSLYCLRLNFVSSSSAPSSSQLSDLVSVYYVLPPCLTEDVRCEDTYGFVA